MSPNIEASLKPSRPDLDVILTFISGHLANSVNVSVKVYPVISVCQYLIITFHLRLIFFELVLVHDCTNKVIKLLHDLVINCKSLQKQHSITKRSPFFSINYLKLTVIHKSLRTRTDNPDKPIFVPKRPLKTNFTLLGMYRHIFFSLLK